MYAAIRLLDRFLSHLYHVRRFSSDPNCVIRISVSKAPHPIALPGLELPAGDPIIIIHLDNEHLPPLPEAGPDLAWALRGRRLWMKSMSELCAVIRADPELSRIRVIGTPDTALGALPGTGAQRFLERLGFVVMPHHNPLGRFGKFWENVHSYWLMAAYNRPTLRGRSLTTMEQIELWMTTEEFLRRFSRAGRDAGN
jgi:hypothetical protein